jgi:3-phosphoshikimate 1-carboxyvinyltransferase
VFLKTKPSATLTERTRREFHVPGSKSESQRAILIGSLANGRSTITNDLRCRETNTMKRAVQALGAVTTESGKQLVIDGASLGKRTTSDVTVIHCEGSGLVARIFTVLGLLRPDGLVITGDDILRGREMKPLFEALDKKNCPLVYLGEPYRLPIVVRGVGLKGGEYELPGDVSSQFITALLLAAPFAEPALTLKVRGTVLSGSYLRQTIAAMKTAGVRVEHDDGLSRFRVTPGEYRPFSQRISGDYTSASYFLAAAALSQGTTVLGNIDEHSLQGERAMVQILEAMDISCHFQTETESLIVENPHESLRGNYEFDVSDCPNIVPTLAALGSFVEGVFRVVGASIAQLHKSPRVDAMVTELQKLGVDITPLSKNGLVDGFEVRGRPWYDGGQTLSSWRDHRVFMSLFVASLRHRKSNLINGYADVDCSFPGFFEQFEQNGARFEVAGSEGSFSPMFVGT